MLFAPLLLPRHRRRMRLRLDALLRRCSPRRITPLTWLIWAALAADVAAPGYLVFNLGFTRIDISNTASAIATEVVTGWEVITDANRD